MKEQGVYTRAYLDKSQDFRPLAWSDEMWNLILREFLGTLAARANGDGVHWTRWDRGNAKRPRQFQHHGDELSALRSAFYISYLAR